MSIWKQNLSKELFEIETLMNDDLLSIQRA